MSFCATAIVAANRAVKAPTAETTSIGVVSAPPSSQPAESSGKMRSERYTPAETIVAAWIMAETGVGPSMASGSQTCSGNCADLPTVPMKSSSPAAPATDSPRKAGVVASWCSTSSLNRMAR